MAHEVESMMFVREKPWHYMETKDVSVMLQEAPNSADALRIAGLDWTVEGKPMFTADGMEIPGYKANTRNTDGAVLGVVTDRYKVVQNSEAFAFTDELIGGDVRYETAGSLRGGKTVWMLARMPETKLAGDATEPYLCFKNSHDGTGAVQICMTPVRVVCNNTLNFALRTAKRSWSTIHMGRMDEKLEEAKRALEFANEYMEGLAQYADEMANADLPFAEVKKMVDELFPIKEDDSDRVKVNMTKMRNEYGVCYFMPDLAKFEGTAWGAVNAMADMVDHNAPLRQTESYEENNWGRIMDGHAVLDAFAKKVQEAVGVSV